MGREFGPGEPSVRRRDGPLLPLRSSSDTSGEVARLMAKFEERQNAPEILRVIANSERGFSLWVHGIDALMYRSSLPGKDREAAILRLAAKVPSRYAWEQHSEIAMRLGMSPSAVDTVSHGVETQLDTLPEGARLAAEVVDVVLAGEALADDTWAACQQQWGDDGAFDLLLTIAWWGGFVPLLIQMFGL